MSEQYGDSHRRKEIALLVIIIVAIVIVYTSLPIYVHRNQWRSQGSLLLTSNNEITCNLQSQNATVGIQTNSSTNTTNMYCVIEVIFGAQPGSQLLNFTLESTYLTWGANYAVNDSKRLILISGDILSEWTEDIVEPSGFSAMTLWLEIEEYSFNNSMTKDYLFRIEWEASMQLDEGELDNDEFEVLFDFGIAIVEEVKTVLLPLGLQNTAEVTGITILLTSKRSSKSHTNFSF